MKNGKNRERPKSSDGHSSDMKVAGIDFNPGPDAPGAAAPPLHRPAEAARRRRRGGEPMSAPPTLTAISLGGGVQSSVMALMASGGAPDCVVFADARWEPPGPCARIERLETRLRFLLYVVNSRRSLCEDVKALANRPGSRSCAGIPVRLKPPAGQADGIGRRQCADNRKGRRRGGGRTVVRLNTAALRERLTALNRSQNRLASEIGVGPAACRRRSTRGGRLRRPFQIGGWT